VPSGSTAWDQNQEKVHNGQKQGFLHGFLNTACSWLVAPPCGILENLGWNPPDRIFAGEKDVCFSQRFQE